MMHIQKPLHLQGNQHPKHQEPHTHAAMLLLTAIKRQPLRSRAAIVVEVRKDVVIARREIRRVVREPRLWRTRCKEREEMRLYEGRNELTIGFVLHLIREDIHTCVHINVRVVRWECRVRHEHVGALGERERDDAFPDEESRAARRTAVFGVSPQARILMHHVPDETAVVYPAAAGEGKVRGLDGRHVVMLAAC